MRFSNLARRSAAVTAVTALISSGGALSGLLVGTAYAAPAQVSSSTPPQADNRSSVVTVKAVATSPGQFLPGDVILLHPDGVLPWVAYNGSTGGTDTVHEVNDIVSGASTLSTDGLSVTANVNLVMAPPGRYDVLVRHRDNEVSAPTGSAVLKVYDYGAASVRSVAFGTDASGGTCDPVTGSCARGDGSLDITGSNFAKGADVQFLTPAGAQDADTHLHFVPGNPGNTNGTGYPTTTLLQGNYSADPDVNSLPSFVPGRHLLRVVNTYPSTDLPKKGGTTVEFWQPWFIATGVATSTPSGAAVIGAGAQKITLTVKGRGFRPGSTLSIQGHNYAPQSCGDISVLSSTVTSITPTSTDASDSLLTAVVSAASCTASGARALTVKGPEGAYWSSPGALTINPAPTVDQTSFATLGQGANHYGGLTTYTTNVTGTNFDTSVTPSATTCPHFDFGAGTTATTVTCGSNASAEVRIDVDPGATPGKYGVTVTNPSDGGSSATPVGTSYTPLTVDAGPSITSVTPTSFQPDGSTKTVTVTGRNFASATSTSPDMTVQLLNPNDLTQPYPGVSVVGTPVVTQSTAVPPTTDATLTFQMSVTSSAPFGRPVLVLTNPDHGTTLCTTCLGVDSLSVSPASAGNSGSSILTLTGTPLSNGTQHLGDLVGANTQVFLTRTLAADGQGTIFGASVTKTGSDTATVSFDLTEVAPGAYDGTFVADTTAATKVMWTCTGCFLVNGNAISGVAIAPNQAGQGATDVPVTVTGAGFSQGTTLTIASVTVGNVVFYPSSGGVAAYLTALVTVPSSTAAGGYDVTVSPADGKNSQTLTKGFTVNPAPAPTAISPTAYGQGAHVLADGKTATTVTVTGTDFGATGTVLDLGDGITVSNVKVTKCTSAGGTCAPGTSDSLTATVVVAPDAATGARAVTVRNSDGGVGGLAGGFTVDIGPKVLSLADDTGASALRPDGVKHVVTIVGSGYDTNKGVTLGITPLGGIVVGTVTVVSNSKITAEVTVPTSEARGARTVSVLNTGDNGYGECAATPNACAYVATEPGSPAPLTLTPGARSLKATWAAAPSNGAPVTSYRLAYTRAGTTTPTTVDVAAPALTYTITGLVNGGTYAVSVVAVNGVGRGPSTSVTGVAGAPAALSLLTSTAHATYGQRVLVYGKLLGTGGVALGGRSIVLAFYPRGARAYTRTVTTNSKGQYGYGIVSPYNVSVRSFWSGDVTTYRAAASVYRYFTVAARVLKTSPANLSKSSASTVLKISGTVAPNKKGSAIYLYRVVNGRLTSYAKTTVSSTSTFTFAIKPRRGTYTFRVFLPTTVGNAAALSSAFTLYRV